MYPTLVTLHVIFAGIWLSFFIIELVLRKQINKNVGADKAACHGLCYLTQSSDRSEHLTSNEH